MILAGIVLYNAEEKRLLENISAIYNQVDKLILIDNSSKNIYDIEQAVNNKFKNCEFIKNQKNEGIAYALNQILNYAYDNGYEWFLTLDQDSVVQKDLISQYLKYKEMKKIAMMTCNIIDRNIGNLQNNNDKIEYITKCITSGAFNNTKILKILNGFDDKMFIDSVDFDICATIIENNYKIIRIPYNGLLHEVGHTTVINLFGKEERLYNHSPFRTYHIVRNSIYIIKKHKSLNNFKERLRVLKRVLLIIIFQKDKKDNLKAIIKGYNDSKKMRFKSESSN